MNLENFEKRVEETENLRKVAENLETSGATTHKDDGAAEFATFMKKKLEGIATENEKELDAELHREADKGEKNI